MKKTNKTFKRFAAITSASLLAACAMAPVAFNAFAATAGEVTLTYSNGDNTGHKYNAYKIFAGTVADDGETLEGLAWATTSGADFLTALKASTVVVDEEAGTTLGSLFTDCTTPAAVAEVLSGFGDDSVKSKAFAEFAVSEKEYLAEVVGTEDSKISLPDDGYYVIAEQPLSSGAENKTMSAYLLGVYDAGEGADIEVKKALPDFNKQILDVNDTIGATSEAWGTDADHDIGDEVSFKLTATLPDDYATYKEYKMVFHDALQDTVFEYVTDSATIAHASNTAAAITPIIDTTCGKTSAKGDDCDLEFVIEDVKTSYPDAKAGDTIEIIYKATLTDKAKIGSEGNWNGAYLEYSNNPYHVGEGDTTSITPEKTVVAFTYQVNVDKIDGATGDELAGAGFTLYKKNSEGNFVPVGDEITGVTTFEFKGLDDGVYKLDETKVPDGYNKADAIEFTIEAGHASKTLVSLTGGDEFTGTVDTGILETEIENNAGATLPGTGGIGTTIFYLGGGAMAAIGGIYLISKRRMKKSEE